MIEPDAKPSQVYITFIRATPQAVWDALTDGTTSRQYFFGYGVEVGAVGEPYVIRRPDGALDVDGEVLARREPHLLRVLWRLVNLHGAEDLQPADVEYRIETVADGPDGVAVKLTVSEFHRGPVPETFVQAGRTGWALILAGLKTLLETGRPLPAIKMEPPQ